MFYRYIQEKSPSEMFGLQDKATPNLLDKSTQIGFCISGFFDFTVRLSKNRVLKEQISFKKIVIFIYIAIIIIIIYFIATIIITLLYGWLISRAVIGRFQVRKLPYGPLALDHHFKNGIINKAI